MVYWKDGSIKIKTSKNKVTETTKVEKPNTFDKFDKIEIEGMFEVDVTYGSEEKVEIDAPAYMKGQVKARVKSKTLFFQVGNNRSLLSAGKVKVHITTAKLNGFSLFGSSSVRLNNSLKDTELSINSSGAAKFKGDVEVDKVDIELSGAAKVNLSGAAESASLDISGAARMNDYTFEVNNLDVDLSGASKVEITCLEGMKGDISGAGSLKYGGSPKVKSVNVSAAASLNKK